LEVTLSLVLLQQQVAVAVLVLTLLVVMAVQAVVVDTQRKVVETEQVVQLHLVKVLTVVKEQILVAIQTLQVAVVVLEQ
jgi:hypothetical protein